MHGQSLENQSDLRDFQGRFGVVGFVFGHFGLQAEALQTSGYESRFSV